jgi:hypothetical protein
MTSPEPLLPNRLSNLLEFAELDVPDQLQIPPEQQENIQKFVTDLQASIDQPPSEESLEQWRTITQEALADGNLDLGEVQAIAAATYDVFDSMGLTKAELRRWPMTCKTLLKALACRERVRSSEVLKARICCWAA